MAKRRHSGNVPHRFLQQGVRNGAPSKFAMHVKSPHTPYRLRCQARFVRNHFDPRQSAVEVARRILRGRWLGSARTPQLTGLDSLWHLPG
jgi:hypothetical protein